MACESCLYIAKNYIGVTTCIITCQLEFLKKIKKINKTCQCEELSDKKVMMNSCETSLYHSYLVMWKQIV